MDNLSHSLVGLLAGEFIHRSLPKEESEPKNKTRRRLLLTTAWAASNFPDLDIILTPLLYPPLGYLLHHRGHTHTFFYLLPQALLLFAMIWVFWPSARILLIESKTTRVGVIGALTVGFVLHLLMDLLNSYGIHPFYPFDATWYYGDMTFILEPMFWVGVGIPLALLIQRSWLKLSFVTLLLGVPLFFMGMKFLNLGSILFLFALAALLALVQIYSKTRALISSALCLLIFLGVQAYGTRRATSQIHAELALREPSNVLIDAAMSSFPSHPFCWFFLSIEKNEMERTYEMRRGVMALAPELFPVTQCPQAFIKGQVEVEDSQPEENTSFVLFNRVVGDIDELKALKEENCHFEAWLRFARAPVIENNLAYDLRFHSTGRRENFSAIQLDRLKDQPCPTREPQWDFPRRDLLQ